jgi:O-antigen/teichoic acid export membrane protein
MSTATVGVGGEVKALLRDSSHYFLGLVANLGLGFVSFPIFTRLFSVTDYGLIDLVQKLLLIAVAASKLGLPNAALRFYNSKQFAADPGAERRYYSTMFFGSVFPAVAITLAFAGVLRLLPAAWVTPALGSLLIFASLLIVPRVLETLFWSFLRIQERTHTYNILTVLIKALTIAAVLLLLRWRPASAHLYFAATTLVEAVFVAGLIIPLAARGELRLGSFDRSLFGASCAFGMPLIINEIAFVILDAGDRALVQHYLGGDALGIYAVAYGLANIVQTLLLTPLNLAVLPLYLRLWESGARQKTVDFLSTGLDLLLMAAMGMLAIVSVASPDLVVLMASPKYRAAAGLLPVLVGGLLIFTTYYFISAGLIIHKQTMRIAVVMACSAVVRIVLNCVLLPRLGLAGAAIATLLGYAFCIFVLAYVSFQTLRLSLNTKAMARYAAAWGAACLAAGPVHIGAPLWSAAAKSAIAAGVYLAVLYALDARVRLWTRRLLSDPVRLFAALR